jgi:signal transduction histidine kinase/CheY-like chemotaxis protein
MLNKIFKSHSNEKVLINKLTDLEIKIQRQQEIIAHLQSQISGSFTADFKDFPGLAVKASFLISDPAQFRIDFASAGAKKYLSATPDMLREYPMMAFTCLSQHHQRRLIRRLALSTRNLQPFMVKISTKSNNHLNWLNVTVSTTVSNGRVCWQFIAIDVSAITNAKNLAVRSNDAKLLFISKLSHTLRNPLNTIMGYSQLIEASDDVNIDVLNDAKTILQSCERIDTILNDVFDATNIELGVFSAIEKNFNLRDLISGLHESYNMQAIDQGSILISHFDIPQVDIRSDPERLKQALGNLLSNAIRHSEMGEIIFSCTTEINNARLHATITITDTGVGIEHEKLSALLNSRESLLEVHESSVSKDFIGSGSGLRISKMIVERLGGTFGATSIRGVGTTFKIRISFPVTVSRLKLDHLQIDNKSGPLKILIADDSVTNRKILSSFLTQKGHVVVESPDGLDAIKRASDFVPNIIFMDLDMPNVSGLDATMAIRSLDSEVRNTYIVAMTGQVFERDRSAAKDAGMDDFLAKPYNFSMVNKIIDLFSYV